jgi:hypothetical protein
MEAQDPQKKVEEAIGLKSVTEQEEEVKQSP